jgi:hypothetical protein
MRPSLRQDVGRQHIRDRTSPKRGVLRVLNLSDGDRLPTAIARARIKNENRRLDDVFS